jgi:hypothetical protein
MLYWWSGQEEEIKMIGFHNARFWDEKGRLLPDGRKGRKRRECYGKLEIDFVEAFGRDWIKSMGIIHEHPLRGSIGTFHVDFYLPSKRIAIETDPELHSTYEPVVLRDARRNEELAEMHGVVTLRITPSTLYDPVKVEEIKALLEASPNSKRTLDSYAEAEVIN